MGGADVPSHPTFRFTEFITSQQYVIVVLLPPQTSNPTAAVATAANTVHHKSIMLLPDHCHPISTTKPTVINKLLRRTVC